MNQLNDITISAMVNSEDFKKVLINHNELINKIESLEQENFVLSNLTNTLQKNSVIETDNQSVQSDMQRKKFEDEKETLEHRIN